MILNITTENFINTLNAFFYYQSFVKELKGKYLLEY